MLLVLVGSFAWRTAWSWWSHFRHHTDTLIVGRDLEIRVHRPATLARTLWILTALPSARSRRHCPMCAAACGKSCASCASRRRIRPTSCRWHCRRQDETTVVLADGLCTHQHVPLADGVLVDGCFECPKYNGRFDTRDAACRRAAATVPLQVYEVQVQNGCILTSFAPRKA